MTYNNKIEFLKWNGSNESEFEALFENEMNPIYVETDTGDLIVSNSIDKYRLKIGQSIRRTETRTVEFKVVGETNE